MATRNGLQVISSSDYLVKTTEEDMKLPSFGPEQGSSFGWNDSLFYGYQDGMVLDYGPWESRDIEDMLKKDYKSKQIYDVLTLPIRSAEWSFAPSAGDAGECDWLTAFWAADHTNGGCRTPLSQIIALATSAIAHKRAFFELKWRQIDGGKIGIEKVGWRPQTTCRIARDAENGDVVGFQQEQYFTSPSISAGKFPLFIPKKRAYIYLHGSGRDPVGGTSDLEVPYWCYKTKQKLMFLWFQFMESVALPRTIVKSNDVSESQRVAKQVAQLRNSGVVPVGSPGGPQGVSIETLDSSGKGGEQFMQAINWLDSSASHSVLAGFLELTGMAAPTGNGYALSQNAGDFFLQQREADARELEASLRQDLFRPLMRYNFGPRAAVPAFKFEPLNDVDKTASVEMLSNLLRSRDPNLVPSEFIGELAQQVATYLGMDGASIRAAFDRAAANASAQAAAAGATQAAQQVASIAGATTAATNAVVQAQTPTVASPMPPASPTAPPA